MALQLYSEEYAAYLKNEQTGTSSFGRMAKFCEK